MKHVFNSCGILIGITLFSCNTGSTEPLKTDKVLFHTAKQEVNLEGSVLLVDSGIMVLVQDGPMKTIPTVLISGNDSAKTILKDSYEQRMNNRNLMSAKSWVKIAGNFIREDSIRPIFKFTWVEMLDKQSEIQQIEEMEE